MRLKRGEKEDAEERAVGDRRLRAGSPHPRPEHPNVAATLVSLGNAHGDLGDPRKKLELATRALAIDERERI